MENAFLTLMTKVDRQKRIDVCAMAKERGFTIKSMEHMDVRMESLPVGRLAYSVVASGVYDVEYIPHPDAELDLPPIACAVIRLSYIPARLPASLTNK